MPDTVVTIVGGGFAGVEAAWAAASRGIRVVLHEMRPTVQTAVHRTGDLAEIVCSNSFKSNLTTNAAGALKEEMRRLGSLVLRIAADHAVPAGEALAVDREAFARAVTRAIEEHALIQVVRAEVPTLPPDRPLIVATGPLTSDSLAASLRAVTGHDSLAFYDAVAPTVTLESLDLSKVFRASRRGRGADPAETDTADYLNCPLTREEYHALWQELAAAEPPEPHHPDDRRISYFDACIPVEELARRGEKTLAFGPLKPIGLTDPRTGRRPYAVVQLRQENREGTLWGLVGFQSQLRWSDQRRIFRRIPGLEHAEFVRLGVMHRNTYINSPRALDEFRQVRGHPGLFVAGQLTGVEGYLESAAMGILAGWNAVRFLAGLPLVNPPDETVIGSLCRYLREAPPDRFAPMNANWGIVPDPPGPMPRDKREKGRLKSERALRAIDGFVAALETP